MESSYTVMNSVLRINNRDTLLEDRKRNRIILRKTHSASYVAYCMSCQVDCCLISLEGSKVIIAYPSLSVIDNLVYHSANHFALVFLRTFLCYFLRIAWFSLNREFSNLILIRNIVLRNDVIIVSQQIMFIC